jgi:hypothetical protein
MKVHSDSQQSNLYDVQKEVDEEQAIHKALPSWWERRRCQWVGSVLLVLLLISVIAGVANRRSGQRGSTWRQVSVPSNIRPQFVEICGTWNDRLVVAGNDDGALSGKIEVYQLSTDGKEPERMKTITVPYTIEGMVVSKTCTHIAVLNQDGILMWREKPQRPFQYYPYGERIVSNDILKGYTPRNMMISDDGLTLAVTIEAHGNASSSNQARNNGNTNNSTNRLVGGTSGVDAQIHILREIEDINNASITLGAKWLMSNSPLVNRHEEAHGNFATFTAMSGNGTRIAVASERKMMAVHEYMGGNWTLQAEYDESPRVGYGSIAFSRDGSTVAAGAYEGDRAGTGELHIINSVWPWFSEYDKEDEAAATTHIEVDLSETGEHALVARFPEGTDPISLQVYSYNRVHNAWHARGKPFGLDTPKHSNDAGSVDISDDGARVVIAMMDYVALYESA